MADNIVITIPDELIIGEERYSVKDVPELKEFVANIMAKAAQDEKKKLYQKISRLEQGLISAEQERDDLKNQLTELGISTVKAKPSDNENVKKELKMVNEQSKPLTKEEIEQMMHEKFTSTVKTALQEQLNPVLAALKQTTQEQIAAYREKRLNELGDTVIPEMVTGSTKEEIEASIVSAIEVRKRYPTAGTPPAQPPAQNPPTPEVPPVQVPNAVRTPVAATPEVTTPDVKKMDLREFEAKRGDLLKDLAAKNAYPTIGQ